MDGVKGKLRDDSQGKGAKRVMAVPTDPIRRGYPDHGFSLLRILVNSRLAEERKGEIGDEKFEKRSQ